MAEKEYTVGIKYEGIDDVIYLADTMINHGTILKYYLDLDHPRSTSNDLFSIILSSFNPTNISFNSPSLTYPKIEKIYLDDEPYKINIKRLNKWRDCTTHLREILKKELSTTVVDYIIHMMICDKSKYKCKSVLKLSYDSFVDYRQKYTQIDDENIWHLWSNSTFTIKTVYFLTDTRIEDEMLLKLINGPDIEILGQLP